MAEQSNKNWRKRLYQTIYESNTPAGKAFDISLLILIFISILIVIFDSVESMHDRYGDLFWTLEWLVTILFTIEYILRLISIGHPGRYAVSFLGIVDLLAILPTYLSVLMPGAQALLVLRALRLLRIFRIFKLTHFLTEMYFLGGALKASMKKISIFFMVILMLVIIQGSVMYLIEGRENGFDSIPTSIYWAILTITTVGSGDVSPVTPLGKFVASFIMLTGYAIIAVPTGIITTEMTKAIWKRDENKETCPGCGREGHDRNAVYCKYCGTKLLKS